jgi:RNA polymerase sigma-70 factor (ECF subfamily)
MKTTHGVDLHAVDATRGEHRATRDAHRVPLGPDSALSGGRFHRRTALPRDDRQLMGAVARAREGDHDALRYLYVRYADNVYGYVASIVRDDHEAEDVTQQVFLKLMSMLGKYEQRAVPFSSWLLRLAHNAAVDDLRRRRATPVENVRGADEPADGRAHEGLSLFREALGTLPADQRTVVVLRHVVGLTPGEIAQRLGRSENSIHGLHHRGRRALRTELRRLHGGPVTLSRRGRKAPSA